MWIAIAFVSFAAFLACVVALIRLGFDATGRARRGALPLALLVVVTLGVWIVALLRAPPSYPLETLDRIQTPPAAGE